MSLWSHIAIFCVTGLLIYLGIFFGAPRLMDKGMPPLQAFFGFLWAPVMLLFPLALYLFVSVEGGVISYDSIVERFRFNPIQGKDWLWVVAAVLVTVISDQLLEPVGKYFAKKKAFAPPAYLPAPSLFHFQLNNPIWPDAQPWDTILFGLAALVIVIFKRRTMFAHSSAVTTILYPGDEPPIS
jgi:hypothetical protein